MKLKFLLIVMAFVLIGKDQLISVNGLLNWEEIKEHARK